MTAATTISTIDDLIQRGYSLTAWCPEHGAREIDLNELAERYGRDATYIRPESPIRIRCLREGCKRRNLEYTIGAR